MILIKNAELYCPQFVGCLDILIGGDRILALEKNISATGIPGRVECIDATGMIAVPGFIDGHQHFIGGGGEGGLETRTPEMQLSTNTGNGVTTAVGLLGTDSHTRSIESLYAKTKALQAEGMTTLMLTGSYWYPSLTATGSISRDMLLLEPVIGVKLALADNRGPHITFDDFARLASEVRVSSLITNKPGVITIHTGVKDEGLDLVEELVEKDCVLAGMFIATHINRKVSSLNRQVYRLGKEGAMMDATCMHYVPDKESLRMSAADFAVLADEQGLLDQVTFSSDAGGSIPEWDIDRKRIVGMDVASPDSLLFEFRRLVEEKCMSFEKALRPLTTNPAKAYGLMNRKGVLRPGADADILILDPVTISIRDVWARGRAMVRNAEVVTRGYFE